MNEGALDPVAHKLGALPSQVCTGGLSGGGGRTHSCALSVHNCEGQALELRGLWTLAAIR